MILDHNQEYFHDIIKGGDGAVGLTDNPTALYYQMGDCSYRNCKTVKYIGCTHWQKARTVDRREQTLGHL